jgi:dsRNA-specific ribonuclease
MGRQRCTSVHGLRSLSSGEAPVTPKPDPRGIEPARELAIKLGMAFERPYLLLVALTHRSYVNENPYTPEDNERLEFLGDAVLDFVVGAWVYRRFITMAEGELTQATLRPGL